MCVHFFLINDSELAQKTFHSATENKMLKKHKKHPVMTLFYAM